MLVRVQGIENRTNFSADQKLNIYEVRNLVHLMEFTSQFDLWMQLYNPFAILINDKHYFGTPDLYNLKTIYQYPNYTIVTSF